MYKIPGHHHISMIIKKAQTNITFIEKYIEKGEIENGKISY